MKSAIINDIIELRQAVAFLGEKKSWWTSKFHDSSSKEFLSYIFPKSKNTQFTCAVVATREYIDNQVGANYYHLFRLPMSFEELINKNEFKTNFKLIKSEEEALIVLGNLAGDLSSDGNSGPKNIGSVDMLSNDIIQVIATEYFHAFTNNYKVHPYLN
jgi:hypothetical protein